LNITVKHLLDHSAGYDRSVTPDIGFNFRNIAIETNLTTPASLRQVIEYVYNKPLDFTPGEKEVYSNYGTMLLSYVVTNLTGETYTSYLEKNILNGLEVELYSTSAESEAENPIVQESPLTFASALTPTSDKKVPHPNGGDGSIKEEAVGAFGLKASAATISQFLGSHSAYSIGGRSEWSYRDGTVPGARALAYSQTDIDWSLILNTREYNDETQWERLITGPISTWYEYPLAE
jgi:CubicO group peptidase (beta-lactamase class C family)